MSQSRVVEEFYFLGDLSVNSAMGKSKALIGTGGGGVVFINSCSAD